MNHLLKLDPHENLFVRVPRLPLPKALQSYLLYDQTLDDVAEEIDGAREDDDDSNGHADDSDDDSDDDNDFDDDGDDDDGDDDDHGNGNDDDNDDNTY